MAVKIFRIGKEAVSAIKSLVDQDDDIKRKGYMLRDGKTFGKEDYYLYIDADDEFFESKKEVIVIEGVEETSGDEYEEVKKQIEAEGEGAAEGIGSIFS